MRWRSMLTCIIATLSCIGCATGELPKHRYVIDADEFTGPTKGVSVTSVARSNELKRAAFKLVINGESNRPMLIEMRATYPEGTPYVKTLFARNIGAKIIDGGKETLITFLRFGYRDFENGRGKFIEVDVNDEDNKKVYEIEYSLPDKSYRYF